MRILSRIKSLFSHEKLQREIEDEIQSHLEFETRKNQRLGMSATEARRHAYLTLGGAVRTLEECRDQRGIPFLENVVRDCRHALRAFRRAPALAFAVILTIGLGVGANTTVFAFCKAMLLATLAVPNPQQLYLVLIQVPDNPPYPYFTFPDLQKVQKAADGAASFAGFTEVVSYSLRNDSGTTSTIKGQLVTGNFFSALLVSPIAGRALSERDNDPGQQAVAVLSYRFWKQRFGGDYGAIGKTLLIQRKPVTVLAIMPRDFDGVEPGVQPDIWMPLSVQPAIGFGGYASMNNIDGKRPWLWQDVEWLRVLARSPNDKNGKRLHALLAHWLQTEVAAQLPQVTDARQRSMMLRARVVLASAAGGLPRLRTRFALPLKILMALVVVLLFSGCVNIFNLLLARARAHEHETAIRIALGSSRSRLLVNRMTETLLLVIAGGLLSLPLAIWGSRVILHWLVINRDLQIEISPDWTLFGFTAVVTLVAGLLLGSLPALRTADLASSSRLGNRTETSAPRTRRATRISSILVAGQLALSITSLVIAGLLTRTLLNYERLNLGLDRQHVLSVGIDPSAAGYNNAAKLNALYRELTAAIDRIPGVVSSAVRCC
jgi:predicted permease